MSTSFIDVLPLIMFALNTTIYTYAWATEPLQYDPNYLNCGNAVLVVVYGLGTVAWVVSLVCRALGPGKTVRLPADDKHEDRRAAHSHLSTNDSYHVFLIVFVGLLAVYVLRMVWTLYNTFNIYNSSPRQYFLQSLIYNSSILVCCLIVCGLTLYLASVRERDDDNEDQV